ncbi:MAG: phage tail family protein [Clostridiales bacterium]|nr:phage tail family protein [Clostridiales bacterium]
MKVNSIDIRKYDAKQLTADLQPPSISVNYEWITGALLPTEFETEVQMGHLKLQIYFRGKNRNSIIRSASEFMANFTKACDLDLDGYKGKFRGFMTSNDYEKKKVKSRYIINLEFDGFLYDDEIEISFDGVTSGSFYMVGSRKTPCILEVYAKSALTNYKIAGFGEDDIIVESLAAGKTVVIDGKTGLVKVDGANAFGTVDMWKFPELAAGETSLTFSNTKAKVTIRYTPMWI